MTKLLYQHFGLTPENWTALPLHSVLYECSLRNMQIPTDFGTLLAYITLFLITWYAVVWSVRLVMSVIWPLFIISVAIVIFRVLQYYEPEEMTRIFTKSLALIGDTLVVVLTKALEFALTFFE